MSMLTKFGPVICPVCMGYVYFAEEIRAMGKSFHRTCFKCIQPAEFHIGVRPAMLSGHHSAEHYGVSSRSQPRTRRLSPERSAYKSTAYVTSDYTENGYHSPHSPCSREQQSSGWDDSMAHGYRSARPRWVSSHGGAVRCANCPDLVFANERVDAVGKAFHRLCFKCASCRRLLDRGTACDHKREVFCQSTC
ncbi:cysteine and glycine-rich protein [Paragonimus westermani]|uniref:Cysteine and glycine-rich protein n=1 Tax=Paragonimus westermani TaxID=34504 RepID=A0A5J4NT84_9TREM|nr:cysteine and glycine-rich protein [Paragonimus westermani]